MSTTTRDLFKTIRRIQIQTTHLADDVLAGAYRSAFKGKGIEFEEVREYQPGDEIRAIDWNVTARMGHPYVKNFREERELTVMLVVDLSSSALFGSTNKLKSELITEIGAVLAFSAIKNNDKVGLLIFDNEIRQYLAPKKGLRHVLRVIRELLTTPKMHKTTNISQALAFFGKVQPKRTVCFIISDFMSPDFEHEIALLSNRHDVIALMVRDPYEQVFPEMNLATLNDLETGLEKIIDTSNSNTQKEYQEASQKHVKKIEKMMKKYGAGFVDILTNESYLKALKRFFKIRGSRRL